MRLIKLKKQRNNKFRMLVFHFSAKNEIIHTLNQININLKPTTTHIIYRFDL